MDHPQLLWMELKKLNEASCKSLIGLRCLIFEHLTLYRIACQKLTYSNNSVEEKEKNNA